MNAPLPDVPEVRVVGLPQLTSGFDLVERLDLALHLKVHGPLEPVAGERLAALADEVLLRGRGGAGFPFARKLRAVARTAIGRGIRPVVVVNGSEDEPACRKDTVLLNRAPHLVLDGALLAAEALGARTLVIGVTRDSTEAAMTAALAERGLTNRRNAALRARVQRNPHRMVTGEASALVRSAEGGPALPPGRKVRASDTGVGGAPTLLSNAETFAQLAVAARIGPARYRNTGLRDEPGTVLLTLSGSVARPMVIEVPTGVPLRYVLQLAGAPPLPQGVLTGGYHGRWLDATAARDAIVSRAALEAIGGALGAGAVLPIGPETCPLGEALRVANWLAAESTGQCGPCRLGLPAAAGGLADLLTDGGPTALEALREVVSAVRGRGACKHPDGTASFVESTLAAFADDVAAHVLSGGCGRRTRGLLPLPTAAGAPDPGATSGERLAVDWTLCEGHGLCADVVPELIRLGPDGFPAVADASVPLQLRGRAQRAVRRCPALALRLERSAPEARPALPGPVGRKALDSGRS
ncbi:NADH-ubiquinone oxidoreductase-F iron-sulfur binding region domain-containing protein [Streptomyces sp. LHD-70]|uniref:NADH-ubiquinone oxidoreductase-F iron-sulfur binding region domain-containing protein n=1 Tax=Streptomyces sp. LHD-70 TaxID=3072140 RepID=UPI00280D4CB9|nr:NADH-ubiquinone oxidoreductase-F iron-sulfur binding region domain-containing protein [Streptomyces sp. LHD-70]MDQ8700998.1 NADH-ubiquinone oxidoreductase-F iron-sulfur binding region domain-containing protein [Streptomyces sp. LHD-70]